MSIADKRLTRQQRRQGRRAAFRAARSCDTPEDAIKEAERILKDEYGIVETLVVALLVKFITWVIPKIWDWIKKRRMTNVQILGMLEKDYGDEFGGLDDD